jgi:hypothetical protein
MTTLTHAGASDHTATRQQLAKRAAFGILFWAMAAGFVVMADQTFGPISPAASFAAKSAVIVIAGYGYMRWAGRKANITHALFVGIAWLLLDIIAELLISTTTGRSWFLLLGSPSFRYWRDALLFTWIAAPALFAHYE